MFGACFVRESEHFLQQTCSLSRGEKTDFRTGVAVFISEPFDFARWLCLCPISAYEELTEKVGADSTSAVFYRQVKVEKDKVINFAIPLTVFSIF